MALMTVLIPVVGPDGQETCKQVSLRALIDDYLRESLLLGWRACSKVSFVGGTQASASETNGVLPSGPSNDYAAAAGMTISMRTPFHMTVPSIDLPCAGLLTLPIRLAAAFPWLHGHGPEHS